MNRGVPPTDLKARTGEFTPPGVTVCARSKAASLRTVLAAGRTVIAFLHRTKSDRRTAPTKEGLVRRNQQGASACALHALRRAATVPTQEPSSSRSDQRQPAGLTSAPRRSQIPY